VIALLLSRSRRDRQPSRQSSPARRNVVEKPTTLATAAPAAPVAAAPAAKAEAKAEKEESFKRLQRRAVWRAWAPFSAESSFRPIFLLFFVRRRFPWLDLKLAVIRRVG
jgi:hypothetical protein